MLVCEDIITLWSTSSQVKMLVGLARKSLSIRCQIWIMNYGSYSECVELHFCVFEYNNCGGGIKPLTSRMTFHVIML